MYRILACGNTHNLVDLWLQKELERVKPLTAVVMGTAYGGDVESFAKILGENGQVYGFDTFRGQPRFLARDQNALDAQCMVPFYEAQGLAGLSVDYQRSELERQGLRNAHLVKGLIHPHSCAMLDRIDYALLDLDFETSMRYAYWAVWPKLVPGGLLVTHDVVPEGHMPWNYRLFFGELISLLEWEVAYRNDDHGLVAWRRKSA